MAFFDFTQQGFARRVKRGGHAQCALNLLVKFGQRQASGRGLIQLIDHLVQQAISPAVPAIGHAILVGLISLLEQNTRLGETMTREFFLGLREKLQRLLQFVRRRRSLAPVVQREGIVWNIVLDLGPDHRGLGQRGCDGRTVFLQMAAGKVREEPGGQAAEWAHFGLRRQDFR